MELLTEEIEQKLQSQYELNSEMETQTIYAKLFIGGWTWYLMNQDPKDPDYLWAIVKSPYGIETGSVSKSELETVKVHGIFEVERDLYFRPMNAKELWDRLNRGEHI